MLFRSEEIKPNRAKEKLREGYDLAVLSKKLAAIDTNVPIDYSLEAAKLENLYTKEAYLLCKRLDLKQILSRFQTDVQKNGVEESFRSIEDFAQADAYLTKAKAAGSLSIVPAADGGTLLGAAVCFGKEDTAFLPVTGLLTEEYLKGRLLDLIQSTEISFLDLKAMVKFFSLPTNDAALRERLFDCTIAAYLLNPLKNGYEYEDIAKDYLNLMIPSREDFLGKRSFAAAMEIGRAHV